MLNPDLSSPVAFGSSKDCYMLGMSREGSRDQHNSVSMQRTYSCPPHLAAYVASRHHQNVKLYYCTNTVSMLFGL